MGPRWELLVYAVKAKYHWPKLNESISQYLKNCTSCQANQQKTQGGEKLVETTRKLEKVGLDFMFLEQTIPILTCIDYHTRKVNARYLTSKSNEQVLQKLKEIFNEWGNPTQIIIDNGREFMSNELEEWCAENETDIHKTSPGKHQSNGRIERFNRNMWKIIRKKFSDNPEFNLKDNLSEIIEKFNKTYHRGLKCTPNEMSHKLLEEKDSPISQNNYSNEFKTLKRETFIQGEEVLAQNINTNTALLKADSRYTILGTITKVLENDSYIVNIDGKPVKRNHAQL